MRESSIWIAVWSLLFALAAPAAAQPFAPGPGAGFAAPGVGAGPGMGAAWAARPEALAPLKEALGLSDAQVQQLIDLRKKAAEDNQAVAGQIRAKRQEIANLMKSANPDPAKIGQLHLDIQKLHQQRLARLEQLRTQTQTVLTAQQRTKLADLEKALSLAQAARQAAGLGLIAPPERPDAPGLGLRPGLRMMRPGRAAGWI